MEETGNSFWLMAGLVVGVLALGYLIVAFAFSRIRSAPSWWPFQSKE